MKLPDLQATQAALADKVASADPVQAAQARLLRKIVPLWHEWLEAERAQGLPDTDLVSAITLVSQRLFLATFSTTLPENVSPELLRIAMAFIQEAFISDLRGNVATYQENLIKAGRPML